MKAADVLIASALLKVNATPFVWAVDLAHNIDTASASWRIEPPAPDASAAIVRIFAHKASDSPSVWGVLSAQEVAGGARLPPLEIRRRREAAMAELEARAAAARVSRKTAAAAEEKRHFEEDWEREKALRSAVISAQDSAKASEAASLDSWAASAAPPPPPAAAVELPPPRQGRVVTVSFSSAAPSSTPARGAATEQLYARSRYVPESPDDVPWAHKERGDAAAKVGQWQRAAACYGDALARDPVCLMAALNRAACWLRLHRYDRCVEDCAAAMAILASTPATDIPAERYRDLLVRCLARRAAARAWGGDLTGALGDLRHAVCYRTDATPLLALDCERLEAHIASLPSSSPPPTPTAAGRLRAGDAARAARREADRLNLAGKYAAAVAAYGDVLAAHPGDCATLLNRAAALLLGGDAAAAARDCDEVVGLCTAAAAATLATRDGDAQAAAATAEAEGAWGDGGRAGRVLFLLKALVRRGACLCAQKKWAEGAAELRRALGLTPYDDDLRADCERVEEIARTAMLASGIRPE